MTALMEVTITYDSADLARNAARDLIEQRLAACVHVAGPIESTFWWDGAVQFDREWRLTAKTSPAMADRAVSVLLEGHPYDLPGLVIHPCTSTPEFAEWVASEASGPSTPPA
ncbi:divalent-cation tolerance protein CutA [Gymnodinialimonas sp. 2305UL16-5]|uniref:divalent-cation tolerance protein CutA n=1 Tax=Gymnodinialimonas mytili TaxID=3126503 RepID=UPI00309863B2